MKEHSVKGVIWCKDQYNISYPVCYIEQVTYEDGGYNYIFKPYYNIMDLLHHSFFQGIPGLNLDLQKETYIRSNKTPTFIYERTPQENREDLWELLDEVGLEYLDKLEWLIRTDKEYTGDSLYVERYIEKNEYHDVQKIQYKQNVPKDIVSTSRNNLYTRIKLLLTICARGAFLNDDVFNINDSNRTELYNVLYPIYKTEFAKRKKKQQEGINQAKKNNKYKGRKKITVPHPKLEEVIIQMEKKQLSAKEAMDLLNLKSKTTLYRRINEFKELFTDKTEETNTLKSRS